MPVKMHDVSPRVFCAMQNLDITLLASYPEAEIRPVLPSLVRMSLLSPLDNTESSMESRKQILAVLIGIEVVNSIVSYLQVNYHELENELKKELQARQKSAFFEGQQHEYGLQSGIALGFERADVARKVRVVLSEIFNLQQQVSEQKPAAHSEMLDDGIYLEEVVDILCIALAELPSLLNILELADALVHVPNGHRIICALVANFPDCYRDVVSHVIANCDEDGSDGKHRLMLLMGLSEMNPSQALANRSMCVDMLKVPSFMLKLTLKHPEDLIAFLTGLLLGNDQNLRSWFAVYIRSSQKRKGDALNLVRIELLQKVIQTTANAAELRDFNLQGAVLLRLYCALRGIGGLKFNDDEINALSQLVTSCPQATPSGIRFVTLALCMLIACPSLVSSIPLENKAVEWLQWLIREDAFFCKRSGTSTSLGEMLLLLAIHFHSNQISAISEMVCSTLAMKIPIRPNSTNRIKQLFTQDLFTEQVVALHAVRVPVTPNLNGNIPGYLPVHCIHQLLKSRTFLKHKVPIKSWIFKQICNSVKPVHPVIPALVEVFVNTLIIPNPTGKVNIDHMHRPFTEAEILHVFRTSKLTFFAEELPPMAESDELAQIEVACPLTAQLLMIYYLMLYEDTRLMNLSVLGGRKQKEYSNNFLGGLPLKYLLQKAHNYHNDYLNLFHPLLRLIISNYPHLSMVDDWLEDHNLAQGNSTVVVSKRELSPEELDRALAAIQTKPHLIIRAFKQLLQMPPETQAQYGQQLVQHLPAVFGKSVPRYIKDLYIDIWLRLNAVLPTTLWIMSLRAITNSSDSINRRTFANESLLEPMEVLSCPRAVFCSPYLLMILLRILKGSLAASKTYLNIHIQQKQVLDKNGLVQTDADREELKTTLIASQESAAVHILLEVLDYMAGKASDRVSHLELREIQGIIGTYVHQAFITEPSLAKLVHFQTYPKTVIPLIVASVPSMHICIDFVHEFLNVTEMDKQIFTIELTSHLVLNYSIPKSLGVSKFCLNVIQTTLSLLTASTKCKFLRSVLPAIVRFVQTFPILADDCVNILMTTGRSLHSQSSLGVTTMQMPLTESAKLCSYRDSQLHIIMIEDTFKELVTAVMQKSELY
ncbi:integrator complex subunit 2 [Drosophila eugracilis]|uniref:integrator complex subunit 2 n=1 Tax=Drosophila eugracilis TaxID=29029 RepID=UPI0007E72A29|nr:integrator complex subunit 2 [Drosophila eugracilis]XP_017062882.1 integrator complex subunit 2 [Drosophila eugracilis]XP_017062883.1 integrator complex subunit 2 [Drosophila eugracilis]